MPRPEPHLGTETSPAQGAAQLGQMSPGTPSKTARPVAQVAVVAVCAARGLPEPPPQPCPRGYDMPTYPSSEASQAASSPSGKRAGR
jgi:hypothetical protein